MRAGIVQETAGKISQTVRCRWHVRGWGWVGPDSGESFGRVGRREVSTIAIVMLLDLLYQLIWLEGYVEKKGRTHRSNGVCLGWDRFGNSVIPMRVHIWNLRILLCVAQSEGKLNITSMTNAYRWWGRVVMCRIVIGCVDDALPIDALLVITSHVRVLNYTHR